MAYGSNSFLRWAGGKTWLIPFFRELTSELNYKNYYEPFLGGAAVFLSITPPKHVYLSDLNKELIETYIAVRDHPEEVIKCLQKFENSEEDYYRIRSSCPKSPIEKAARFIFLNHTSYNGLYRVNKNGEYNVPYGFSTGKGYDVDKIRTNSELLKKAKISCEDFAERKYRIKEYDLVFLDPPYTVSHNKNGFIEYNQKLFSLSDQYRLREFIDFISNKGAYYILTNAAHETILKIFDRGDYIIEMDRNSLIGGKNAKRQKVSEYIFTNIPKGEQFV